MRNVFLYVIEIKFSSEMRNTVIFQLLLMFFTLIFKESGASYPEQLYSVMDQILSPDYKSAFLRHVEMAFISNYVPFGGSIWPDLRTMQKTLPFASVMIPLCRQMWNAEKRNGLSESCDAYGYLTSGAQQTLYSVKFSHVHQDNLPTDFVKCECWYYPKLNEDETADVKVLFERMAKAIGTTVFFVTRNTDVEYFKMVAKTSHELGIVDFFCGTPAHSSSSFAGPKMFPSYLFNRDSVNLS